MENATQNSTDVRPLPEAALGRDRIVTNVLLYRLTGTAGPAARIYDEDMPVPDLFTADARAIIRSLRK